MDFKKRSQPLIKMNEEPEWLLLLLLLQLQGGWVAGRRALMSTRIPHHFLL